DADDDRVRLAEPVEAVGGLEAPGPHPGDHLGGDVADVALPPPEPGDLGRVDVEPQDRDPLVGEGPGQRQADVAQADDPDPGGPPGDPPEQVPRMAASFGVGPGV